MEKKKSEALRRWHKTHSRAVVTTSARRAGLNTVSAVSPPLRSISLRRAAANGLLTASSATVVSPAALVPPGSPCPASQPSLRRAHRSRDPRLAQGAHGSARRAEECLGARGRLPAGTAALPPRTSLLSPPPHSPKPGKGPRFGIPAAPPPPALVPLPARVSTEATASGLGLHKEKRPRPPATAVAATGSSVTAASRAQRPLIPSPGPPPRRGLADADSTRYPHPFPFPRVLRPYVRPANPTHLPSPPLGWRSLLSITASPLRVLPKPCAEGGGELFHDPLFSLAGRRRPSSSAASNRPLLLPLLTPFAVAPAPLLPPPSFPQLRSAPPSCAAARPPAPGLWRRGCGGRGHS